MFLPPFMHQDLFPCQTAGAYCWPQNDGDDELSLEKHLFHDTCSQVFHLRSDRGFHITVEICTLDCPSFREISQGRLLHCFVSCLMPAVHLIQVRTIHISTQELSDSGPFIWQSPAVWRIIDDGHTELSQGPTKLALIYTHTSAVLHPPWCSDVG